MKPALVCIIWALGQPSKASPQGRGPRGGGLPPLGQRADPTWWDAPAASSPLGKAGAPDAPPDARRLASDDTAAASRRRLEEDAPTSRPAQKSTRALG